MNATGLPVLDLAEWDAGQLAPRNGRRQLVAIAGAIAVVGALGAQAWTHIRAMPWPFAAEELYVVRIDLSEIQRVSAMSVDDRSQILAEGSQAETRNEAIPFSAEAAVPMGAFNLVASQAVAANALRCMTQAIYYEAANEPVDGRRAVAQVVLNRVRHPAYPKSVCEVVYQGAERQTGCQFSFTCDGSLLRQPMARQWQEAGQIAREALAGRVERDVGTATHYHADYVLPRWAFEMDKIAQLGRHLFYRFEGSWGKTGFFSGAYSGHENVPALDIARLRARLLAAGIAPASATEVLAPGLTVAPHVTDRHADNDVGGRLDTTRTWRLSIPDPTSGGSRYRALVEPEVTAGPVSAAASPQDRVEQLR